MPETATEPIAAPAKRQPFRFTRENAREMSRKGNDARWKSPTPEPVANSEPIANPNPTEEPSLERDGFNLTQLNRVRAQLNRINDLLDRVLASKDPDTQAIERLSRARTALQEDERRLADRSLPPVLRAIEKQTKRGLLNELPE